MKKLDILQTIAQTCNEKQAENIVALDMKHISLVADYFLICDANNQRKVQAIAKAIQDILQDKDIPIQHVEGMQQGRWIIIDTGYIMCHIFHEEERSFYELERLWGDADRVSLQFGDIE